MNKYVIDYTDTLFYLELKGYDWNEMCDLTGFLIEGDRALNRWTIEGLKKLKPKSWNTKQEIVDELIEYFRGEGLEDDEEFYIEYD